MKKVILVLSVISVIFVQMPALAIDQTLLLKLLELKRESYLNRRGELSIDINNVYTQDKSIVPWMMTKSYSYNLNTNIRLGVSDRLEVTLKIPSSINYRDVYTTQWDAYRGSGLGDPSLLFQYEMLGEKIDRPAAYLTGGLRLPMAKSSFDNPGPNEIVTGSGHLATNWGLSFLKSIDPCALYWGAEYQWVMPRGGFNPGDTISYNLGLAWSLNQAVNLSLGLGGMVVGEDKQLVNGVEQTVSSAYNIAGLNISSNVVVTPAFFINPSVYLGLTDEDTDFLFQLGLTFKK